MDLNYIPFAFPGLNRVKCVFQTRAGSGDRSPLEHGNISYDVGDNPDRVTENRRWLQERLRFGGWQELKQVHGTEMVMDPEPHDLDQPGVIEADGLATAEPGQALVIKTADCQPILIAHQNQRHVAALHVGWRGNRQDFPQKGVRDFCQRYGLKPRELFAVRGPSLGPGQSEFVNFDQEWGPDYQGYHDAASRTVDLWRLTRDQLLDAGLLAERLFSLDLCTRSLESHFFSYRANPECGRQASLIWLDRRR